ncbi:MAG TPA: rhomboid family intramembrane serine protease [Vicinamibacterales bacterium]
MPTTAFALLVLSGAALYFMNPEERARLARFAVGALRRAVGAATHPSSSGEPFDDMLRARTGRPLVTPLLLALNALVFTLMLFGPGAFNDTQTLIDWGANYAPRTTNGEWWRLIAAMFVHGGVFHLAATMAGLLPLGLIMERAMGRIAFATTYLAAGLIAGVVSLWTTSPMSVSYGASGALFGIYGLLLASLVWGLVSPPAVPVPLLTVKRLAAAAVPFFLYNLVTDHLGTASELAGLGAGFTGGLVVARGWTREKPAGGRAAVLMAATVVIVVGAAVPLRGILDFRPEVARIAAVEERTAGAYDEAVAKFRLGRIPAKGLIQLIDRTIIPELQGVRARVIALRGVPPEQAPLAAAAEEYFQLREASWRRRAEGLLRSNLNMLRDAEQTEHAALDAFRRMRPAT